MLTVTESKFQVLLFKIFTAMCLAAAIVCLICDLAVNKGSVGWSPYVIASCAFAQLVAAPALLLAKHKILFSAAAFTALLLPFLFAIERVTGLEWFVGLALPVSLAGLAALWAVLLILRVKKINRWRKSAIFVFIGTCVYALCNIFTNGFLGEPLLRLSDYVAVIACSAVVVLLFIIGTKSAAPAAKPAEPADLAYAAREAKEEKE